MIEFLCPRCRRHGRVPDSDAGKTLTCRRCKQAVIVPTLTATPSEGIPTGGPPWTRVGKRSKLDAVDKTLFLIGFAPLILFILNAFSQCLFVRR